MNILFITMKSHLVESNCQIQVLLKPTHKPIYKLTNLHILTQIRNLVKDEIMYKYIPSNNYTPPIHYLDFSIHSP